MDKELKNKLDEISQKLSKLNSFVDEIHKGEKKETMEHFNLFTISFMLIVVGITLTYNSPIFQQIKVQVGIGIMVIGLIIFLGTLVNLIRTEGVER